MTQPINSQRFTIAASVIATPAGAGQLRFAPAGEDWQVTSLAVLASSAVKEAQVRTYSPYVGSQYVIDTTNSGSTGDTTDTTIYLNDGTGLIVAWTGADAGATLTATLSYYKSVVSRGFRAI